MKMNSLTDYDVMEKLAEASRAGVRIDLIIRGICCLRPGVPGHTEHISVTSVVGRFLEHSRIYAFGAGEESRVFIASGDMMTRNTERRVEVACPICDPRIKTRLLEMMDIMLRDNVKAREQFADGRYILRSPLDAPPLNAQEHFMQQAKEPPVQADWEADKPIREERRFLGWFRRKK